MFYRKYFERKKRNFKFEINERSRHFQFSGNVKYGKVKETWKLSNSRPRGPGRIDSADYLRLFGDRVSASRTIKRAAKV